MALLGGMGVSHKGQEHPLHSNVSSIDGGLHMLTEDCSRCLPESVVTCNTAQS